MMKNPLPSLLLIVVFLSTFASQSSSKHGVDAKSFLSDTAIRPFLSKAKSFEAKNTTNSNGLVTLTSGLDNDYYILDSTIRRGFLYIEVKTARQNAGAAKRLPLNLSIVIDRSGSMAGEKMGAAQKAAKAIVDKLTPTDFVSVVIYDEYIDVLQPAVHPVYKDSIKAKIGKIKPRGSTNLWGGSARGYEQVKSHYKPGFINRVLLISDGRANAGIIQPLRIRDSVQQWKDAEGITLSTFGVGLDYNEVLMTDMAETGAGNYYYIDKAESMETVFEKELTGLLNAVAQNAELRITLPKGISVAKIYPFKYKIEKNEIIIRFRDLFASETKALVMQFSIDNGWKKDILLSTKLSYTDVLSNQPTAITNTNLLRPTKRENDYLSHFNKAATSQAVLFAANENMEKAMLEADKGKYEKARAMIEMNADELRRSGFGAAASPELRKMDSLSTHYGLRLNEAKGMSADSVQRLQKSSRADNYNIRNKKN